MGEDGKYWDITTIKDDVQQGKALDFGLEETIRIFLKDAHRIGIPRSQGKACTDVEVYLKSHNIPALKFKNQRPGMLFIIIFILHNNYFLPGSYVLEPSPVPLTGHHFIQ